MAPHCPAADNPNTNWPPFCPSVGAAYLYAVLFGLTFIAHVVQMFVHRKPYSWVICTSAGMQTAAYILRILSIQNVANSAYYTGWFVLLMVAPVWTNAFAYMVMGRMAYNFTATASVAKVRAWNFGLIFVLLDVLAFLIQAGGALIASGSDTTLKTAMIGIHIYMGGIGLQQLCIFGFLLLAVRFHQNIRRQPTEAPQRKTALWLLYVEYTVVALITVRIIFRLIEYSSGITSSIPRNEAFQYVFDSTPMLIALVLFNVFHPGRLMPGKESNMPKRKERKALKKQGQIISGRAGEYLMLEKEASGRSHASSMRTEVDINEAERGVVDGDGVQVGYLAPR